MEYQFGKTSQARLEKTPPRSQLVFRAALAQGLMDISIIQGVRTREEQDRFYEQGRSKVQWPDGKHNIKDPGEKAKAVDAGPYINGKITYDHRHCCYLSGLVQGIGRSLGGKIRWGGNWDQDGGPFFLTKLFF
jgi:peptidoglycan L-alanyl-D-glutamate endopeptidase CwlK